MVSKAYLSHAIPLIHVTPRRNVDSIRKSGLLVAWAGGAKPVIWLCTAVNLSWALRHVAKHHKVRVDDMAIIYLSVRRRYLTRWRRGIYRCQTDLDCKGAIVI